MPFGVSSGIPNVIIHAIFRVDRLRGFCAAGPPKVPFPILIGATLTTVLHYRADCDHAQFHPDPIRGFVSAHAPFCASNCLLGYLFVFLVLQIVYSQDARTDFDAKYVKRRGSAQGRAFWGSQNQKISFTPLFGPKTEIWGPIFDGTNFRSKTP